MARREKSSKESWLGQLVPIALAVLVVGAAALGFQLLYSSEQAASKEAFAEAERQSFLKKHYPLDLTSAPAPAPKAPAAASSH